MSSGLAVHYSMQCHTASRLAVLKMCRDLGPQAAEGKACRVLFISARADVGGGPEHLYQLIRYLKQLASAIQLYAALPEDKPYYPAVTALLGTERVITLPHRRFSFGHLFKLRYFIRSHAINLVHSHGKGAGLYARLVRLCTPVKVIHTFHGLHIEQYHRLGQWLYRLYEQGSAYLTDRLVFVSPSEQAAAQAWGLAFGQKATVVVNGTPTVERTRFTATVQRLKKQYQLENKPVVATLSRFDYSKNMILAYAIAKQCPDLVFLWVGDGEQRAQLQARAKQEGITNIRFVGFTQTPLAYLMAADVYLSTARWEGLPLALLEALSVGLPIVATRVTGNNDILNSVNYCYGYDSNQPDAAVRLIRHCLTNLGGRAAVRQTLIAHHKTHYSAWRMAQQQAALYGRVVASNGNDKVVEG